MYVLQYNEDAKMAIFDDIMERKVEEGLKTDEMISFEGEYRCVDKADVILEVNKRRVPSQLLKSAKTFPEELKLKKEIININSLIREVLTKEERTALIDKRSELLSQLDVFIENYKLSL